MVTIGGLRSIIIFWASCWLVLQTASLFGQAFTSTKRIIHPTNKMEDSTRFSSTLLQMVASASSNRKCEHDDSKSDLCQDQGRRNFVRTSFWLSSAFGSSMTTSLLQQQPMVANAAMENAANPFEKTKTLTVEEAKDRFKEGRKSIQYLLDHYDEICDGGGDNVRRYLGTVGTKSGLFGISKVMKAMSEEADDVVEYTETMNEVDKCIQQADGSAYMAIFVTTSTSYTPPAKYFGDAKIEVKRCIKAMDELAAMIDGL